MKGLHGTIELHTRFEFTAPPGQVTTAGIRAISRFIASQRVAAGDWLTANPDKRYAYLPGLPNDWRWVWLVERGALSGTFPKRLARYYRKVHGLKCPEKFLAEIGNLARTHSTDGETFRFEFTNRIDWRDGDFGDEGSCYWNTNTGGRLMVEQNGYAVCFFDADGGGLGRAWIAHLHFRRVVVFNGYGFPGDSTLIIARTLAGFWGMSYGHISLVNNGSNSGSLYINGVGAYLVAPPEYVAITAGLDLCWKSIRAATCQHCGAIVDEGDIFTGPDDSPFCEDCYANHCATCDECGGVYWQDELRWTGDADVCDWCYSRYFTLCDDCGDDLRRDAAIHVGEHEFCADCRQNALDRKSAK